MGITFVYVTNDQEEAFSMSDRVAVMNRGVLEQVGTPEEVYRRPATLFVADFVGEANRLSGTIRSAQGDTYLVGLDREEEIDARGIPGLSIGSTVTVLIRPEQVRVASDGRGMPARVIDASFMGSVRHLRLENERFGTLIATLHGSAAGVAVDSEVGVTFDPDAAWVVT